SIICSSSRRAAPGADGGGAGDGDVPPAGRAQPGQWLVTWPHLTDGLAVAAFAAPAVPTTTANKVATTATVVRIRVFMAVS
ncbi:MAG: hypothetical protein LPK23_10150, partial [Rhodococcus sp. (in: high G+C Gram-positive bacteria)]|nr:hypothetical protein [Rhodococcus sp. (in: high G+C Gram-positive bacteria)]MDX5454123.1 hypothetical protein [Rhodococcus sp. (in: high G+C Gram-positive bacteria)]